MRGVSCRLDWFGSEAGRSEEEWSVDRSQGSPPWPSRSCSLPHPRESDPWSRLGQAAPLFHERSRGPSVISSSLIQRSPSNATTPNTGQSPRRPSASQLDIFAPLRCRLPPTMSLSCSFGTPTSSPLYSTATTTLFTSYTNVQYYSTLYVLSSSSLISLDPF